MSTLEKLNKWKKERDAIILAHYYVDEAVQKAADYVGDSFYLSKIAAKEKASTILYCGVSFMGESAKILSPDKTVLLPDKTADCPMAHMADIGKIEKLRKEYEDLAVVCYINSTALLKTYADVCVTSSNACKIVSSLPNQHIYFIPDENLGRYVASKAPEKHMIFNDGYCHVHNEIQAQDVVRAKEAHPAAEVLVHPECTMDVVELADYVGSTSGIIEYATASRAEEFIIGTELGVLYELRQKNPKKCFYAAGGRQCCPDMKLITLEKMAYALEHMANPVELDEEIRQKAKKPLEKMLELG